MNPDLSESGLDQELWPDSIPEVIRVQMVAFSICKDPGRHFPPALVRKGFRKRPMSDTGLAQSLTKHGCIAPFHAIRALFNRNKSGASRTDSFALLGQ